MQTTLERNGNAGKTQLDNSLSNSPDNSPASLPDGIRTRNDGLLSLKDIAARLDPDADPVQFYGRLRRLADAPGIGEYLGAVKVPGAKGVRYEPRAAQVFGRLIAASDESAVTPATAVAWLKASDMVGREEGRAAETPSDLVIGEKNAIAGKTQSRNSTQSNNLDPVAAFAAQGRAQGLAMTERVLTAKEAAEIARISPALLRKSIAPWRRFGSSPRGDRWLLSQLLSSASPALPAGE